MRGKPAGSSPLVFRHGITPADAGKTGACCRYRTAKQDHPRGCGENCPYFEPVWGDKGSPPRMRGKPARMLLRLLMEGITPADAGKTNIVRYSVHGHEDHPRGCGENTVRYIAGISSGGSPPRMRGKPETPAVPKSCTGITPADAGKTTSMLQPPLHHGDHPRGCGENTGLVMSGCAYPGSPPRMRGKHLKSRGFRRRTRITPAGAGKTRIQILRGGQHQDHPRRCGENSSSVSPVRSTQGSPPQVRGKLCNISRRACCSEDHPRRCGENVFPERTEPSSRGSPPQVRGKLLL